LSLVACGTAFVVPSAAALLGLAAFGLMIVEVHTVQCASYLVPRVTSRNAIGQRAPVGEPRQTVVVTAHIDSAQAGLAFHPRVVKAFRALFVLMAISMVLIPGLAFLHWLGAPRLVLYIAAPFALHLLVCVALLGQQHFLAPVVPGAGDNASGVATLILVARALRRLAATDLWIVGTGAEEAGLFGMLRLLRAHQFHRATTYFLNVDSVVSPGLHLNSAEGMVLMKPADPHLLEAARAAAEQAGIEITVGPSRVISSDAVVPLARNYRVLTVAGEHFPQWHWGTDVADNVAPEGPANAADVVCRTIRALDDEPAGA
ncbi:MAG: M28 family peptidase, partial [Armatimonadota bacterium]